MRSSSGSGSRNTDSGGRQPCGSRKGGIPTIAEQADARIARLASRVSGAANAKDDGMGEAARAAQRSKPVAAAAETTQSRKRSKQLDSSSEDDGDLEAAGVVDVSQVKAKLKRASHQPVHAFIFDCNTCLTHHSIFFAGNLEQYLRQRRPAWPEHFARARRECPAPFRDWVAMPADRFLGGEKSTILLSRRFNNEEICIVTSTEVVCKFPLRLTHASQLPCDRFCKTAWMSTKRQMETQMDP